MTQQISELQVPVKSRQTYVSLILWLFFVGAHNFYAGYHARGFVQLLLTVLMVVGLILGGGETVFIAYLVVMLPWCLGEWILVHKDAKGTPMG
jgi:TM2 domain-containing membrane protein YozV